MIAIGSKIDLQQTAVLLLGHKRYCVTVKELIIIMTD